MFIPFSIIPEKAETAKKRMAIAKSALEQELKAIDRKKEVQKKKIESSFE